MRLRVRIPGMALVNDDVIGGGGLGLSAQCQVSLVPGYRT